jgi:energy-coupling factor transporter ATP-binding protein EcfA2
MEDEMTLKTMPRNVECLFKKNIVLYGANNSGKTTLLYDIMKILKPFIPNIVAFCPTTDSNNALKGVIPDKLIFRKVDLKKIKDVYSRQKEATIAFNNANDLSKLKSLFKRVAGYKDIDKEKAIIDIKEEVIQNAKDTCDNIITRNKQCEKVDLETKKLLTILYKSVINKCKSVLKKMILSKSDIHVIKFLNFNPNMLIVFDDCASVFTKKFQNDETIKDLFWMYRHSYITIIFTFQDDTGLESCLRKNASLSFFTTDQCAMAYFERKTNSFSKSMKMDALTKIGVIFNPKNKLLPEFSKFLYIRGDPDPIRYYCAQVHEEFRFGSDALWQYCHKIEDNERSKITLSTFGQY